MLKKNAKCSQVTIVYRKERQDDKGSENGKNIVRTVILSTAVKLVKAVAILSFQTKLDKLAEIR